MKTLFCTNYLLALALSTVAAATTGCDEGDGATADEFGADDVTERCAGCTIKLNTFAFGKVHGGELDVKGDRWDGVQLLSVRLRCTTDSKQTWRFPKSCKDTPLFKVDMVHGEHGELVGQVGSLVFRGADFLKSQWRVDTFDVKGALDEQLTLTVNQYSYSPADGLHYYTFDLPNDGSAGNEKWIPACKDSFDPISGAYVGTKSVVFDNLTVDTQTGEIGERDNTLYIACVSAAVGKAGTWGLRPWDIGTENFTTAVRAVRADYCGDGGSWTTPGNPLQLEDVWGNSGFVNPLGATEAVWGSKGALCLGKPRWVGTYDFSDVSCNGEKLKYCDDLELGDFPDATMWTKLP